MFYLFIQVLSIVLRNGIACWHGNPGYCLGSTQRRFHCFDTTAVMKTGGESMVSNGLHKSVLLILCMVYADSMHMMWLRSSVFALYLYNLTIIFYKPWSLVAAAVLPGAVQLL